MWLFFLVAWFVLLAAIAIFAQQAFGYDVTHLPALFAGLPMPQRIATGALLAVALALIGATAFRLSRQDRRLGKLRDRLKKTREDVVVAHALQNHLDATVQHLIESDPREAVSALHDKLGETEQRALLQQGRNESTDMHDQLAEIRRRQQGLREMVGKVAEQRRAVEPIFTEIRDRQNQLERSLHDLETDDRKNNLADRLKDIAHDISALLARVNTVQDTFATLNQYKKDLAKSHAELMPLRSTDAGINALISELGLSHDRLAKSIDELETGGEAPLGTRVETLSKNRIEIEQRLARIDDSFNILKTIRLDFEELGQRQAQLERSLAEIETDPDGTTLVDRQNALNDFVIQSRQRLGALQETLATLNAFKTDLSKSQADLVPLKAPVFGIEALIAEVGTTRDLLAKTVGEIEANGGVPLASRVDALAKSKRDVEDRLARIFDNFNALDALRKDIGGIFSTIRNSLNRIG
ncbi:DNA repair exonuclease SbcCD ATPase subunit [Bradyrhizobium diazoefficiens]